MREKREEKTPERNGDSDMTSSNPVSLLPLPSSRGSALHPMT